ncbi:MAG: hypothetical protein IRZ16_23610 [Myxococcaceae bacterium]|nr:hypothetical protein [Myxococcaceae bacterium]
MNLLRSPKQKLIAAAVAVLGLALIAPTQGVSAATAGRALIAALAVAGLIWWFYRQRHIESGSAPAPRLRVLSRAGLSPKTGIALVEADGRNYLVVYGDGFAELQTAPAAPVSFPAPKGRRPRRAVRKGVSR